MEPFDGQIQQGADARRGKPVDDIGRDACIDRRGDRLVIAFIDEYGNGPG
jgi:hypothetical protein